MAHPFNINPALKFFEKKADFLVLSGAATPGWPTPGEGEEASITVRTPDTGCVPGQKFILEADLTGITLPSGISATHSATGNLYDERWMELTYLWNTDIGGSGVATTQTINGDTYLKNDKYMTGYKVALSLDSSTPRDVGLLVVHEATGAIVAYATTTITPRTEDDVFTLASDYIYVYANGRSTAGAPAGVQVVSLGVSEEFNRSHSTYQNNLNGGSSNGSDRPRCIKFEAENGVSTPVSIVFQPADDDLPDFKFSKFGSEDRAVVAPSSSTGNLFQQAGYVSNQGSIHELAINGLSLTGTFDPETDDPASPGTYGYFLGGGGVTDITVHNCLVSACGAAFAFGQSEATTCQFFVGHTTIEECGGQYPTIWGPFTNTDSEFVYFANDDTRPPLTDRAETGMRSNIRVNYSPTIIVQKCNGRGTQGSGQGWMKVQEGLTNTKNYVNLSDNSIEMAGGQVFRIGTNVNYGRVTNCFIARNYLMGGPHVREFIICRGQGLRFVGNYCNTGNGETDDAEQVFVQFNATGTRDTTYDLDAAQNFVNNNTFGSGRTTAENNSGGFPDDVQINGYDVTVSNNIEWGPNYISSVETHTNLEEDSYVFTSAFSGGTRSGTVDATYAVGSDAYPTLWPEVSSDARDDGTTGTRSYVYLRQQIDDYTDLAISTDAGCYGIH